MNRVATTAIHGAIVSSTALSMSGCAVVGGIFKTGIWVGVLVVILVLVLIFALMRKFGGSS